MNYNEPHEDDLEEIIKSAKTEEDEPFQSGVLNVKQSGTAAEKVVEEGLDSKEERKAKRDDKKYYTAFRLIIGCLVMLGLVYLVDVIFNGIYARETSQMTSNVIEIIKTMLFTLSGYLFGKKGNGDG